MGRIGFITCDEEEKKEGFPHNNFEAGVDYTCLGENIIFPAKCINNNGNELILGPTGSGKSLSIATPRILHTYNSSLVIPIVKRQLFDLYAPLLKNRGYTVIDLDLVHPDRSPYGYDPMSNVHSEDDMLTLATAIVGGTSRSMDGTDDRYWSDCTAGTIAALQGLSRYINGDKSGFKDFMDLYQSLEISYPNGHCRCSLDADFEAMETEFPRSQAPRLWRSLTGTASRTASCVVSILNNALSRFCGSYGDTIFAKRKIFDIKTLGLKKTALFITTNSVSEPCKRVTNLLYANLFKELFDEAERHDGKLLIPVHIIADDFAAGAKIEKFADHISVFRAAGISCSLLLQSLSQLNAVYGDYEAAVIRENCDSVVYFCSTDMKTCKEMAERASVPLEQVLSMRPEDIIISRRGIGVTMGKRYPVTEDEIYRSLIRTVEKE